MFISFTTVAALLLAFFIHLLIRYRARSSRKLPPGPLGYPLIGNLLDIPTQYEWRTYSSWARQYGDIITLTIPGSTIILLHSYTKAIELLEAKGSLYSERPYVAMTGELMGFDRAAVLYPYNNRLKMARRLFSNEMGTPKKIEGFHEHLEQEGKVFVNAVAKNPEMLFEHIYRHAGAIILQTTYGYQLSGNEDHFLELENLTMESFNESLYPGRFLCNQIPFLRHIPPWIPGAGFKKIAKAWRDQLDDAAMLPLNWTRSQIAAGNARESFVAKALKSGVAAEDEELLAFTAASMSLGGSDTSAVSVSALFVFLAQNPSVQKKAQAEIDSIVGRDRVPTVQDTTHDQMPYLDALLKELLRCHPPVPLSIPHSVKEDDWYESYFIPKGATIVANVWHMCYDPKTYANPKEFNPSRFLGSNPELNPRRIVFGFGRRICPGRVLAETSIRIAAAMILWSFDISGDGKDPEYKPMSGAVSHLERIEMRVVPRPGFA